MAQGGIDVRRDDICLYLGPADRAKLEAIVADRNSPRKWCWRAEIVLGTADGLGTNAIRPRKKSLPTLRIGVRARWPRLSASAIAACSVYGPGPASSRISCALSKFRMTRISLRRSSTLSASI